MNMITTVINHQSTICVLVLTNIQSVHSSLYIQCSDWSIMDYQYLSCSRMFYDRKTRPFFQFQQKTIMFLELFINVVLQICLIDAGVQMSITFSHSLFNICVLYNMRVSCFGFFFIFFCCFFVVVVAVCVVFFLFALIDQLLFCKTVQNQSLTIMLVFGIRTIHGCDK